MSAHGTSAIPQACLQVIPHLITLASEPDLTVPGTPPNNGVFSKHKHWCSHFYSLMCCVRCRAQLMAAGASHVCSHGCRSLPGVACLLQSRLSVTTTQKFSSSLHECGLCVDAVNKYAPFLDVEWAILRYILLLCPTQHACWHWILCDMLLTCPGSLLLVSDPLLKTNDLYPGHASFSELREL